MTGDDIDTKCPTGICRFVDDVELHAGANAGQSRFRDDSNTGDTGVGPNRRRTERIRAKNQKGDLR